VTAQEVRLSLRHFPDLHLVDGIRAGDLLLLDRRSECPHQKSPKMVHGLRAERFSLGTDEPGPLLEVFLDLA
jgi:hypothetical protein